MVEGRVVVCRFRAVGLQEAVENCDGDFEAAQDRDKLYRRYLPGLAGSVSGWRRPPRSDARGSKQEMG